MKALLKPPRYPGRDRVLARDDAANYLFERDYTSRAVRNPCERPVPVYGIGLPSITDRSSTPLPVEMSVRCRQCAECLMHRRNLWTARAVDEVSFAPRTWFGTLTVAPTMRFQLECEAELRLHPGGETLRDLTPSERYRLIADYLGKEVTRYLKRLRKSGARFRYLLVFEAHKDGFPHCHLLLHEAGEPVRKKTLDLQWKYGFSRWKLVDREPSAAVYVCKYLAKDALTRVRASGRYGQGPERAILAERLENARDALERRGTEPVGEERSDERTGVSKKAGAFQQVQGTWKKRAKL